MKALVVGYLPTTTHQWLSAANFLVEAAGSGEEALELVCHYEFDLLILDLDVNPPDMESHEMLRRLRNRHFDVPVVAISAVSRPEAKVRALELGADDYLTEPFDRREGLARIQVIIRRSKGFSRSVIQVGPLQIDLSAREATMNGRSVPLTGKEYAILELLALRKGTTISKEGFLDQLYGGIDEPGSKVIDVFICKLRRKLAAFGCDNLIHTTWGRGYILREQIGLLTPASNCRSTSANRLAA